MNKLYVFLLCMCLCRDLALAEQIDVSRTIEPGGAVRVDINYGRVRVVASEPGRVRVTGQVDDRLRGVSLGRDAGAMEVRVRFPLLSRLRARWEEPFSYSADLLLEVPADTSLFVVSRDAEIEIDGLQGPLGLGVVSSHVTVRADSPRVTFEAVSGSLDYEGRAQSLRASTLSGRLRVTGAVDVVQLEAATGNLELLEARVDRAALKTVSGDVWMSGEVEPGGTLDIETQSGEVKLECCGGSGADLDLESRNGEILNEANLNEANTLRPVRDARGSRSLVTSGGQSGAAVRVRTRSGLIWLLPEGWLAQAGSL